MRFILGGGGGGGRTSAGRSGGGAGGEIPSVRVNIDVASAAQRASELCKYTLSQNWRSMSSANRFASPMLTTRGGCGGGGGDGGRGGGGGSGEGGGGASRSRYSLPSVVVRRSSSSSAEAEHVYSFHAAYGAIGLAVASQERRYAMASSDGSRFRRRNVEHLAASKAFLPVWNAEGCTSSLLPLIMVV